MTNNNNRREQEQRAYRKSVIKGLVIGGIIFAGLIILIKFPELFIR